MKTECALTVETGESISLLHAAGSAKVIPINRPSSNSEEFYLSLYRSHYDQVIQYAYSFYRTIPDSEDVAQTIFMKLWEKRGELSGIYAIEHYLFVMAKNKFLTDQKVLGRKKSGLGHLDSVTVYEANLTEQDVAVRETRRILDEGLRRLPRQMKLVMTLKKDGYSRKEISRAVGIEENTVKNHLRFAMARMEDCLQVI